MEMLTETRGINYKSAEIYLEDNNNIYKVIDSKENKITNILIKDKILYDCIKEQNENEFLTEDSYTIYVPLRGSKNNIGVLKLEYWKDEWKLIGDNQLAKAGQLNIAETLANTIGLLIENTRQFKTIIRQINFQDIFFRDFKEKISEYFA